MVIFLLFVLNKMLESYIEENGICDILTVYTIQFILMYIAPTGGDYSVILEPVYLIYVALRDDAFIS